MHEWILRNRKDDHRLIAKNCGISNFLAKLLVNREITDEEYIINFVTPTLDKLRTYNAMKDVEKASGIIIEKINNNKKIRIIGDYDVDGVISTYILVAALKKCNAKVDYEIPDRIKDGYGINKDIIKASMDEGIDTIITCDNGISAIEAIKYAKELGMTVIVTDHHDIPFFEDESGKRTCIKVDADAIINPKQEDCKYAFKSLCGAGVALKLIQCIFEKMQINSSQYIDLIEFTAIATVCDVVDLVDENRIIVKNGLEMISNTNNLGLRELIKETGIGENRISVYHLGFVIGPCINASGRLDSAKKGLRLLLSEDIEECKQLAKELVRLNSERKEMTLAGVERAKELIEKGEYSNKKIYVVYLENIHESLAGIIAGRIREKYNVPSIVLTKSEDAVKGSGRSIEEYNMFEELLKCKDLLNKFGGHPMAAGLSLELENIEKLSDKLNDITVLKAEDLVPKLYIDMQLPLHYIDYDIVSDLEKLQPFGKGNSRPVFGDKDIKITSANIIGANKNVLKIKAYTKRGHYIDGIYFGDINEFEEAVVTKYGNEVP